MRHDDDRSPEAVDHEESVKADFSRRETAFRKISDILAIENGAAIAHNFDGDKMAQYRLIAKATGGECIDFDGKEYLLDLRYWFCHRITMESRESKEIINPIRTVLIDKDGAAIQFVSAGIVTELDTFRTLFGDGPYTAPMVLKITRIKTRSGSFTYTMGPA